MLYLEDFKYPEVVIIDKLHSEAVFDRTFLTFRVLLSSFYILPSFENSDYCGTKWNKLIKTKRIKSKTFFGYNFSKRAIFFNCYPRSRVRLLDTSEVSSFALLIGRAMCFH